MKKKKAARPVLARPVLISLPIDQHEQLKERAKKEDRSVSSLIRISLDRYMKQEAAR